MSKADVLLGLQWGDEGKGKIVDVLTPQYDLIARFQGGPNAGHSLEFEGTKHVLHTIPSGIFHADKQNLIGNGVVIDPIILNREVEKLLEKGVDVSKNLLVSRKAHLILPTHRILDAASEASKGLSKIGSTLKGIGPTYMDKTGRNGIRVGDTELPDFKDKYEFLRNKHLELIRLYDYSDFDLDKMEQEWFESLKVFNRLPKVDSEHLVNTYLQQDKKVLAEGAQGTLLDIDFGSYPFVTSSNTITAGACTGLGIAPNRIGEVFGIFKAYCTRVGSGPFPTELYDETGEKLRQIGREFGSTTGRPRRCGWLDLPSLRYAIMINGVTQLIMMKSDVLSDFDTIKVCTSYRYNGELIDYLPYDLLSGKIEPIYTEIKGWKTDISTCKNSHELPLEFLNYVQFIEQQVNVPITILSVGPDRSQTMFR
ncbi:MAG: adenylosuccinate synthase [Flavobacteriales bacterium]|nr:adenylosuccinate synthase [Flavobacteriales bacterium]